MASSSSVTFIPSRVPLEYAYESGGRVLVLKCALQHPDTKRFHDIRIEKGWLNKWWNGPLEQGITEEQAEQIRQTYNVVLQTIHAKPGEGSISCDLEQTKFTWKDPRDLRKTEQRTSRAYEAGKNDTMIEKADAQRLFASENVTVHDAMLQGILRPLGVALAAVTSSATSTPPLPLTPASPSLPTPKITKWPESVPSSYDWRSTPKEEYASLETDKEREGRIKAHLDKTGPLPFTPFTTNNAENLIAPELFKRMRESLRRLAQTEKRLAQGENGAANGRTAQEKDDDEYMRKQLRHWFRATHSYMTNNARLKTAEEGNERLWRLNCQVWEEHGRPTAEAEVGKVLKEAEEKYRREVPPPGSPPEWREPASPLFMTMMLPTFAKIDYNELRKAVQNDPL